MVEIVISVAAKVAEYLVDPIIRPLGYLFNYRRNITDLNQQIDSLRLERERLQIPVDEANRQGDEIFSGVQEWLTYAEGIIQNRDDFNEDERKTSKSCFYLKSRYQRSKQAKKQAAEIAVKIQQAHNFGGRVSYRPPPPPPPFINSVSFKDCEVFQSRESTFNQIMEALRNEGMHMIGVWGMGGVGKTTLVKQVAQQAEKDQFFHKVVMALNISQTPNITEIQGKIASMLGLTLENNNERAVRLRQSLKKQEKILVILDDIWEKLELGEIGIPYGDDHKGCKVLLTSRERQVLSKDMRTQQDFHLQHLSEDEAWNLFKKTAGDSVEKRELRPIAVDVAKECEGLPLAIVTIANALRDESVPVWENALDELRRSAPTNIRGVSKSVYSCLELSYNHLESDEVKSLFLLCALLGDGDISMDRLLQYAMGLSLFEGIYSWDKGTNKLIALVQNLKASSLLLEGEDEDEDDEDSLFFNESMSVRMHDVIRDVARAIASKDPHRFKVKEAVGSEVDREWMDDCTNCTRISLKCRGIDQLPQGLICPELEFFSLASNCGLWGLLGWLEIPNSFFQGTRQLRVLDLSGVFLTLSRSSLGFLSNLRTLCLNHCKLEDIAVIGDLKRLQVLSLAGSSLEQLPKEMMQLSDLRVLDLRNCRSLKVIPRNVIWSLSQLEYLSMKGSFDGWEKEGSNSTEERMNACLSELNHLSGLRTLELRVPDPSSLPEDRLLFNNQNLIKYSIEIGEYDDDDDDDDDDDELKFSRRLILDGVDSLQIVNCFSELLKRSKVVRLSSLNDTKDVVYELDKDGFLDLEQLFISYCPTIQYIIHSRVDWVPPPHTLWMLRHLDLYCLRNLEAVCHGPIPKESFANLGRLRVSFCKSLKYFLSLPTEHARELAFPKLFNLTLEGLPELVSFYSTGSSGTQELVTLFSQQVAFPALEKLVVGSLDNVRALWHHQLPTDSFSKLKILRVYSCNKILNVFPLPVTKALVQLEDLRISYCEVLEAIVANEDEDEDEDEATPLFLFPKLTSFSLHSLHQLKRFCSKKLTSTWPLLKKLNVINCDDVEILFQETGLECELDNKIQQPLFLVEKEAFPNLEELNLTLKGIVEIWRGQFSSISFSKLRVLKIIECHGISAAISSNMVQILNNLEQLEVRHCDSMNEVIQVERLPSEEFHVDTFPQLTEIRLVSLEIDDCKSLKYLVTPSMARRLVQLKTLVIKKCHMMTEIVGNEGDEPIDDEIDFTRLWTLQLDSLPNLNSFCSANYTFRFPSLVNVKLVECPEMEFFFRVLDTPRLQNERVIIDGVHMKGDLNTHISTMFHLFHEDPEERNYKEEDFEDFDYEELDFNDEDREEDFEED